MARTILAFFMMACVSVVSVAQTPPPLPPGFPPPARDTSAQPATAVIRGHVFDASSGQPLRRAQVRATSPELRENRLAITDANGAYEIKNLAAGRYSLFANKGSFVGLSYGQTRPFEAGTLLDVHSAQLLEKVDFNLPHGAVIMGRVVDEFGEPTADVQVAAMRYQYMQGRRQLVNTGRPATTNDIGEFRIYALPPGQYIISATYRGLVNINDAASDDRSGYAPTCYPGTANVAEAQRMTITVGQKLSDLNIALSPTRMARVAGTAVDSEGKPIANGMLMMIQTSGGGFNMSSGSPIKPDGTFSIGNVAPGDYTLRFMPPAGLGSSPFEVVQADLSVAGEDITDVRLVGMKPPKVSGRIIPPASQTNTTSFSSFQIVAAPLIPQLLAIGGPSRVNDDGTFEFNVAPGRTFIRMNPVGAFANTRIKSVRVNGVEVIDTGIDFRPNEDVSGVEIELTNQLSSLSGVVTDSRGNIVKDYTVITFARDRERWGPGSRYLNSGRPDQDGKYKLVNLPPGDYYVVALDYAEPGAQSDPEFLDRLRERASEFSINEAETKSLDVKLIVGN